MGSETKAHEYAEREIQRFISHEWPPHKSALKAGLSNVAKALEENQKDCLDCFDATDQVAKRLDRAERELSRLGNMSGLDFEQIQGNLEQLVEQGIRARVEVVADLARAKEEPGKCNSDEWSDVLESVRKRRLTEKVKAPLQALDCIFEPCNA